MFTVKATDQTGHTVYSCHSYQFSKASSLDGFQTLALRDANNICFETVNIIGPTFVMNDAGKTVDKFEPEYPVPGDERRVELNRAGNLRHS